MSSGSQPDQPTNICMSNMIQKEPINLKDHLKRNWKKYAALAVVAGAGMYAGEPGRMAAQELLRVLGGG
jgi:hypothetical protein